MLEKIKALRKEIHQNPELSGEEFETAKRVRAFIEENHNTTIIDALGETGMAVIYDYPEEGPTVVIRCELDALPIDEPNTFNYKSVTKGVSHKCGHDGHMAIVAGLVFWIKEQNFKKGKIVLLFQPAEETGTGAPGILNDSRFADIQPDYIFALHNIPGAPLHSVIVVRNDFTPSVQSFSVCLTGEKSHSAEPEKGNNPAMAIAELINAFSEIAVTDVSKDNFALFTPVYLTMGQKSYGISAGYGEVHYTVRTKTDEEMKKLETSINATLAKVTEKYGLDLKTDWFDYFPSVVNDDYSNDVILKAAEKSQLPIDLKPHPFKFGEDFGWFSKKYKTAMFGLGAGEGTPPLHNKDYDFPEELIESGMEMFQNIIAEILD
ncbi:amidohydrolase [Chondrinema litorale]|uniref:amidohydrolase n=1 Tax=Chondrinema litorale TaxID=2994555 RepID=UPI002542DE55|nr:amidohydrolase [Chondrinema litorale]UZR98306.1 amidohydrolase [Chondrinema litorale]